MKQPKSLGRKQVAPAQAVATSSAWPQLQVSDGSLEALKWLALVLMTVDHVNKFLFNGTNDAAFAAGRAALPLFIFALAYNLSRRGTKERDTCRRTMRRLALFGFSSIPAFGVLGGIDAALRPLNIMFTLFSMTSIVLLLQQRSTGSYLAAAVVFLLSGPAVEYGWPALALGLAICWYCKVPSPMALALVIAALATLWNINYNHWAFLALPCVLLACHWDIRLPRSRWLFYFYYPTHLFALCAIRIPMRKAGYLFF